MNGSSAAQPGFRAIALGLGLLVAVQLVSASYFLASASDEVRAAYLPDDAFYYLQLAKTYATQRLWSVDGGISVTSGFHPLLAYGLALLWAATQPTASAFVSLGVVLTASLALLASVALLGLARELRAGLTTLLAVLIVALAPNYVLNSASIMEWPLVVLLAASYALVGARVGRRDTAPTGLLLAALGCLGSWARSDFGLFPACLWLASFPGERASSGRRSRAWIAGLCGSLVGVAALSAHSYWTTGQLLQSSARMKAHWGALAGVHFSAPARLLRELTGYHGLIALGLVFLAAYGRRRSPPSDSAPLRDDPQPVALQLGLAGAIALLGYSVLYARAGAVQDWYTSTLIVPFLCCVAGLSAKLAQRRQSIVHWRWLSAASASVLLVGAWRAYPLRASNAPWPHQRALLEAARYASTADVDARAGAWNSGLLGYFSGGRVINLDGLVNNDVYAYAVTQRLGDYLAATHIGYLLDFSRTLEEPRRRRRGGYDTADFSASLEVLQTFGAADPYWGRMTLYRWRGAPSSAMPSDLTVR